MSKYKDDRLPLMAARAQILVSQAGSIAEAARLSGVPVNTVSRICAGSHEPGVFVASKLAKGLGSTLEFLLGLSDDQNSNLTVIDPEQAEGFVTIPVLDVRAAAGAGAHAHADVVKAVGGLPFAADLLKKLTPTITKLSCLRCSGNSMSPTILDSAILIVDELQNVLPPWRPVPRKSARQKPKEDGIYVFIQSGDIRLKRLRDLGDDFTAIISDNGDEHPIEIFKRGRDGGLAIIGKVVWWDNRL